MREVFEASVTDGEIDRRRRKLEVGEAENNQKKADIRQEKQPLQIHFTLKYLGHK